MQISKNKWEYGNWKVLLPYKELGGMNGIFKRKVKGNEFNYIK